MSQEVEKYFYYPIPCPLFFQSNFSLPCHLVSIPFVPSVIHIIYGFTDTYKLIFLCQSDMY